MPKIHRRNIKKDSAALVVALQLTALTLISVLHFIGRPHQSANKAPAETQVSAPAQAETAPAQDQTQTAQPFTVADLTAADKSALRKSAHFAKKLYEPLNTQVFDLATARAAA